MAKATVAALVALAVTTVVGATAVAADPAPPVPPTGANPVEVSGQSADTGTPIWGYPWPVVGIAPAPNPVGQTGGQQVAVVLSNPAELAKTGPLQATPWLVAFGLVLIDLGYLAVSATRRGRPFGSLVVAVLDAI